VVRFVHVSDTHLCRTYPSAERVEAFNTAFKQVIDKAIDEKVDFILHSGDLFDKLHPWPNVVAFVKKQLKRLSEANIDFVVVRGNHDGSYDSEGIVRGCSIDLLYYPGLSNLILLDPLSRDGMVKEIGDVRLIGLGYYGHETSKYFKNYVLRHFSKDKKNILILHIFVDGYTSPPPGQPSLPLTYLENLNVDYIALGHEHNRFKVKRLESGAVVNNPGSIEKFDFLESDEKGFYIVELESEPKLEWIPIQSSHAMKLIKVEAEEPVKPSWFVEQALSKLKEVVRENKGKKLFIRIQMKGMLSSGLPSDIKLSAIYDEFERLKRDGLLAYGDIIPPDVEIQLQELKLTSEGVDVRSFFKDALGESLGEKLYKFYMKVREAYADDDSLTRDGNLKKEVKARLVKDLLEGL